MKIDTEKYIMSTMQIDADKLHHVVFVTPCSNPNPNLNKNA